MILEEEWISALKALADRSRLRIIRTLLGRPMTVNDLSDELSISQYNVSKHLRILREAGLVEATKMANRREYAIPSRHRGAGDQILDLGDLTFRFANLAAPSNGGQPLAAGQPVIAA